MNPIAFDLELLHKSKNESNWLEEAKQGILGISVIALWDLNEERPFIYGAERLEEAIEHMAYADPLVSYNGIDFDLPVIEGTLGYDLKEIPHYDIKKEIYDALGTRHKGYKLNDVADRTIGKQKLYHGKDSYGLSPSEKYTYCLHDTMLTAELYEFILEHGFIIDRDGNELWVRAPEKST
jgi:predicted PolB exonuclease-like 3'-5' exonuclease